MRDGEDGERREGDGSTCGLLQGNGLLQNLEDGFHPYGLVIVGAFVTAVSLFFETNRKKKPASTVVFWLFLVGFS